MASLADAEKAEALDSDLLGNLAVAQDLVAILALGEDALVQQRLGGDGLAVLKGVQGAED